MEELSTNVAFWDIYLLAYHMVGIVYICFLAYNLVRTLIDFNLAKWKSFWPRKTYITLSTLNTYENTFGLGKFQKSEVKSSRDALLWFEHLETKFLFQSKKANFFIIGIILLHNMRSLSKHLKHTKYNN